jgi:hypothetical protein
VIAVKEWLQSKLDERVEDPRCTNHYLCPKDNTRWDARWSCICNDCCLTCDTVTEPYATTDNTDQRETIHNQEVYERANAGGQ